MDIPAPTVKRKRPAGGDRPPVEVGQVLTRAQVTFRQKISPNTLSLWEKQGLRMYQPPGSKAVTTGEDVLAFIKQFPIQSISAESAKPVSKKRKR